MARRRHPRPFRRRLAGGDGEDFPGLGRAVDAVLRSAQRQGVETVSAESSYWAVVRKTDILDEARAMNGDKALMKAYAQALREAAARAGVSVVA